MVEIHALDRLRAAAARKRWIIGLRASSGCRRLEVALVGSEGRGLASRVAVHAHRVVSLPAEITRFHARLRRGRGTPAQVALLAAHLAEGQAALLDEFASEIAPVWDRVLAVAVDDPGLWHQSPGLECSIGLCDAARLADLCGLNVIDGFAGRDLAQGGRGRPLYPRPYGILLQDAAKNRLLVQWQRRIRVTLVPSLRDAWASSSAASYGVDCRDDPANYGALADRLQRSVGRKFPNVPRIDQLVLSCMARHGAALQSQLATRFPDAEVVDLARLAIPPGSLAAAAVAILGLLNLDQVPAGIPELTGARSAHVLGRLTPGSLANWRRLVCELAAAKPSVVSLRSAV